jgi:phospholipid-binding lipoprotein MlaA
MAVMLAGKSNFLERVMNSITNNAGAVVRQDLFRRFSALVLVGCLLGGCASSGNPRDPFEPVNRAVYSFNDGFDRAIAKPVAEGYKTAVPEIARTGVTNFFSNIEDVWILVNNLLQGKVDSALDDMARVLVNSTVGLFGLVDVASDLGISKHNEDFGQTLGHWGVASGPYVVLPFLGSSTVRDALSLGLVDMQGDIVRQLDHVPTRNTLLVTRLINTRANLLDASRIVEEAALDKYSFLRDAYLQRRQSLIYDGNPPREPSAALEGQDGVASEGSDSVDAPKVSEAESLPTSTAAVQVLSVVK